MHPFQLMTDDELIAEIKRLVPDLSVLEKPDMPPKLEILGGPLDGQHCCPVGLGARESFMVRDDSDRHLFHEYRRNNMQWRYMGVFRYTADS